MIVEHVDADAGSALRVLSSEQNKQYESNKSPLKPVLPVAFSLLSLQLYLSIYSVSLFVCYTDLHVLRVFSLVFVFLFCVSV